MISKNLSKSLSVSISEEKYTHSIAKIALIVFSVVTCLLAFVLNIIFHVGGSIFGFKLFQHSLRVISEENQTDIIVSKWYYFLWIIVFLWEMTWLGYGVSTIFRKSSSDYLYKYPPIMHWFVYFNFSLSSLLYIACMIFWSRNLFLIAACYLILVMLGLEIAGFLSFFKLSDYQRELYYTEKISDVWSVRILVQNGLFLFASWAFTLFLISLDQTLVIHINLDKKISHLIILGVLFVKLFIYFLLENLLAYKYCKFVFTPWIVFALFLYDTIMNQTLVQSENFNLKNWTTGSNKSVHNDISFLKINASFFAHACLLAILLFFILAKIFKFFWCEFCRYNNYSSL